jgi:hypothetical protein
MTTLNDTPNEIQYVIHMADIHLRNERTKEYINVFDKLIKLLENDDKTKR